jgi:hypothetical protein
MENPEVRAGADAGVRGGVWRGDGYGGVESGEISGQDVPMEAVGCDRIYCPLMDQ